MAPGGAQTALPRPDVGRTAVRSLDLFYLCSYDVGGLREFTKNPVFRKVFAIEPALVDTLLGDETERMEVRLRIQQQ